MDDQLALLAAKIANERPPAIQIRLWLQALLDSRPQPAPQLVFGAGFYADEITLDNNTVSVLIERLAAEKQRNAEYLDTIHAIAGECPDCPCCRRIAEATMPRIWA